MWRILRALWDGLLLRCPRCRRGRMFERFFTMRLVCPHCGLPFERSAGEITGGMGINSMVTLSLIVVLAFIGSINPTAPLLPLLGGLMLVAVVFPILFYPLSRGMWASILYLTGANDEADDIGTVEQPVGTLTHEGVQALIRQVKQGRRLIVAWSEGDVDVTAYLSCQVRGGWVQQTSRTAPGAADSSWERCELTELDVERRLREPGLQITVR